MALKISLEDLIASIKDQCSTKNKTATESMKRSLSDSKSDSDRVKCHVCVHMIFSCYIFIAI